jgi:hypothetical protein
MTNMPMAGRPPPRPTPATPRTQGTRRHKLKSTPVTDLHRPPPHVQPQVSMTTLPRATCLR